LKFLLRKDQQRERVAVAFFLFGLGAGSSFIPLLSIAMAKVPKEDAGVASGIVNVSMQISAAIGLALLATISTDRAQTLSARGESLPDALTGGYHLAFLAAAGSVVIGVGLALLLLRKHAPGPVER
jgi:MFS family permease